jgi:hypothetical protein
MKPKIVPPRSAALFLVEPKEGGCLEAGLPGGFQVLQGGATKPRNSRTKSAALSIVAPNKGQSPNAGLDIYANAFWFAPAFGYLLEKAANPFAFCMELHKNWLTLLVSRASSSVVSSYGSQAEPTAEDLAHYMDIAIGERFEVSSSSGSDIQLSANVLERSMDIAIGERKAA